MFLVGFDIDCEDFKKELDVFGYIMDKELARH